MQLVLMIDLEYVPVTSGFPVAKCYRLMQPVLMVDLCYS